MKIAICGCGIGGLAAAILAKRNGFSVTIFDQFKSPEPVGSGLVIQPVGLAVLEQLGAANMALEKGAKGFSMIGQEAKTGRTVLDVSYGKKGGNSFGLGIHRASLFASLLDIATKEGIEITAQHYVVSSHINENGRFLTFKNGASSGPYDLVIDTSGVSSQLSPLRAKPLPYGALWATVDWPDQTSLSYDCLQQKYRRASNMIGILPIGTLPNDNKPKAALFWSMAREKLPTWKDMPLDEWQSQANALWPELKPFTDQITNHHQMTTATYSHGSLRKPFADRIVFIGDAAHRASPQLGQGANMALVDAAALMKCLALFPLSSALKKYTSARRLHTNTYQFLSWAFTPMYQSNSRLLPILRDYALAPFIKMPPAPTILSSLVKGSIVKPMGGLQGVID